MHRRQLAISPQRTPNGGRAQQLAARRIRAYGIPNILVFLIKMETFVLLLFIGSVDCRGMDAAERRWTESETNHKSNRHFGSRLRFPWLLLACRRVIRLLSEFFLLFLRPNIVNRCPANSALGRTSEQFSQLAAPTRFRDFDSRAEISISLRSAYACAAARIDTAHVIARTLPINDALIPANAVRIGLWAHRQHIKRNQVSRPWLGVLAAKAADQMNALKSNGKRNGVFSLRRTNCPTSAVEINFRCKTLSPRRSPSPSGKTIGIHIDGVS